MIEYLQPAHSHIQGALGLAKGPDLVWQMQVPIFPRKERIEANPKLVYIGKEVAKIDRHLAKEAKAKLIQAKEGDESDGDLDQWKGKSDGKMK